MKPIYTTPKIVKFEDLNKAWYVYFRYDGKIFRYKYGINYIKDYSKRLVEAESISRLLLEKLKSGWNPNIPDIVNKQSELSFIDSLDFAIEKKKQNINPKTFSSYNGTVRFIQEATKKVGLQHLKIVDTKRVHIKLIIEKAKELKKWSNNAHNKHLNHLKAILSELIQWDVIPINPAYNIKNLTVCESEANIPESIEDVEKIKKELESKQPDF